MSAPNRTPIGSYLQSATVKDQYFGDARDYLKYHVFEELLVTVPDVSRLSCLWMLTPPDATNEGNIPFVESNELPHLTTFLRRHLDSGDRRVRHMREYFAGRGIDYIPWGDEPPYFTNTTRTKYFSGVSTESLHEAVVFFDPDIGLTETRVTPKHLIFDDLKGVLNRMNGNSVAVVYQHFQRKEFFWDKMAETIRNRVGGHVGYVADPAVGFYVISRDPAASALIDLALRQVASCGRSRRIGSSH